MTREAFFTVRVRTRPCTVSIAEESGRWYHVDRMEVGRFFLHLLVVVGGAEVDPAVVFEKQSHMVKPADHVTLS